MPTQSKIANSTIQPQTKHPTPQSQQDIITQTRYQKPWGGEGI